MVGFLDQLREKIITKRNKDNKDNEDNEEPKGTPLNDKIALGVLLWVVAEADDQFLPEEMEQIKTVLTRITPIKENDLPCILESIEIAAKERIDLHTFTHEVSNDLSREVKLDIMDNLFRVACVDDDLDEKEQETIRKIAGLFRLDHKDFIDSKIKIKKEFGMDTAGL